MRHFIDIEELTRYDSWNMHNLHSHPHYEIYYLIKGTRNFLFSNAMYQIEAPSLIVIPPHTMHKTEGGPFRRINIDVVPEYLNEFQLESLNNIAVAVLKPDDDQNEKFIALLNEMVNVDKRDKNRQYIMDALFSYYVVMMNKISQTGTDSITFENDYVPPLVMKVIKHLNDNYNKKQTLDELAEQFFVSKATLIYNFNKYLHCSPMDFLLVLRLTKAKELLIKTDKSISEISEECGFSSPNYFSLIFKRKENLSPNSYRRYQMTKG